MELPPEDTDTAIKQPTVKPIDIDVRRFITLKADVTITIPNLIFVTQEIPGEARQLGLTLTVTRPAADGARLTFGTFQSEVSVETLPGTTLGFASSARFDPMSNGITTHTARYQPKFAEIKIASADNEEVRGRLTGEFYRFSLATPSMKPTMVNIDGSFIAALLKK